MRQNTPPGFHFYQERAVEVGRIEVALNIWWYETIGLGLDECEYQIEKSEPTPIVTSNKYYIPVSFYMHRVQGPPNPVPKVCVSTRTRAGVSASYQMTINRWLNNEFGLRWKMDKEVFESAMLRSNEWGNH